MLSSALRQATRVPTSSQVQCPYPLTSQAFAPLLAARVGSREQPAGRYERSMMQGPKLYAAAPAVAVQSVQTEDVFDAAEEEITISLKGLDSAPSSAIKTRFVVPYFVTKPGQQLYITGSIDALGNWDTTKALPLKWNEGHVHTVDVEFPAGKLVEAKLVLFENGKAVYTEPRSREVLLAPAVKEGSGAAANGGSDDASSSFIDEVAPQIFPPALLAQQQAAAAAAKHDGPEYQILCVWDMPEVTEVMRLPVQLPPRTNNDTASVLCKMVVVPDGVKLEGRQRPVIVGNIPELGNWDPNKGVKLMRQVGGHWTCRVSLPLNGTQQPVQAKVVICDAAGKAVAWEPGTTNRSLAVPAAHAGNIAEHMLVFTAQWSNPGVTPVLPVRVQYESQEKEHLKALEAAYREIAMMRTSMSAKQRQVGDLEAALQQARRVERDLRSELTELQQELIRAKEDVDIALDERDEARQVAESTVLEAADIRRELTALQQQIAQLKTQQQQQQAQAQAAAASSNGNGVYHSASAAAPARSSAATAAPSSSSRPAPSSSSSAPTTPRSSSANWRSAVSGGAAAPSSSSSSSSSSASRPSSGSSSTGGRSDSANWRSGWRS